MLVSFHPRARDEVEEAQVWYEERSFLAAVGFLQELSKIVRRISDAPYRYPIILHGTRRAMLERFPSTFSTVRRRPKLSSSPWLIRNVARDIGPIARNEEQSNEPEGRFPVPCCQRAPCPMNAAACYTG